MNTIYRNFSRSLFVIALLFSSLCIAKTEKWLIIGGGRGAAWQLAHTIAAKPDHSCTIFVRDKEKTEKKFASLTKKPTIIQGDVTTDTNLLTQAAQGASYIVIAQTFPYNVWERSIEAMIDNTLSVAQETKSTVIYFARHYQYGDQRLISETSTPRPNSHQGRVLNRIEMQIEDTAKAGLIKAHIICHAFPFGPNIGDGLLSKNFSGIAKNKNRSWLQSSQKFEWVGSSGKVPMQLTYTPDLTHFTYKYVHDIRIKDLNFSRINFVGDNTMKISSINRLGYLYAKEAGDEQNYELSLFSKMGLSAAAMFRPEATRAKDIYYSFEKEILLDETIRRELFPTPSLTPLKQAISETYNWYKNNS